MQSLELISHNRFRAKVKVGLSHVRGIVDFEFPTAETSILLRVFEDAANLHPSIVTREFVSAA
ncbi:MAG: hypothetical protein ABSA92_11400 [Candidatus Bathyarchaeia archaeon]